MYPPPPPGMEKLRSQVNVTFCQIYLQTYPPPQGMEKLRSQVNMTFCQIYLQTYPPPPTRNGKVEISGQCDILSNLPADVPPPPRTRNNKVEISGQHDILVLMISRAGQWTRTPSTTPLQPKK